MQRNPQHAFTNNDRLLTHFYHEISRKRAIKDEWMEKKKDPPGKQVDSQFLKGGSKNTALES